MRQCTICAAATIALAASLQRFRPSRPQLGPMQQNGQCWSPSVGHNGATPEHGASGRLPETRKRRRCAAASPPLRVSLSAPARGFARFGGDFALDLMCRSDDLVGTPKSAFPRRGRRPLPSSKCAVRYPSLIAHPCGPAQAGGQNFSRQYEKPPWPRTNCGAFFSPNGWARMSDLPENRPWGTLADEASVR